MRHARIRVLGLALVATLAVAAVAASSASALPEWGRCEVSPTHEGKYTNGNCTIKAKKVAEKFTGEFEWHNSTTMAGSRSVESGEIFETAPLTLTSIFIKCEPSEEKLAKCREGEKEERQPVNMECNVIRFITGEFSSKSDKEISHLTFRFQGCKALGLTCANSEIGGEPRIITNELKGVLGYIKKATRKEVGIDWKGEAGREIAKFSCGVAMTFVLGGATGPEGPFYPPNGAGAAAIAAVTPINEMVNNVTEVFTANQETGANIPSKFEGKPLQALEDYFTNPTTTGKGSKWGPAGLTMTDLLRLCGGCNNGEGKTELKA